MPLKRQWWTHAFPTAFEEVQKLSKNRDWQTRLAKAWEEGDPTLHPQLVVLGRVLGTRAFLDKPEFRVGDGVTVVQGLYERFPATVRYTGQGLVAVSTDYYVTNKTGRTLFVPVLDDAGNLKFTLRTDGVHRLVNSDYIKLDYGRSYFSK